MRSLNAVCVSRVNILNKIVMNTGFSTHYSLVTKGREIIKKIKLLNQTSTLEFLDQGQENLIR